MTRVSATVSRNGCGLMVVTESWPTGTAVESCKKARLCTMVSLARVLSLPPTHFDRGKGSQRCGSNCSMLVNFLSMSACARDDGASLREIGRELGTSHEAVRQNLLAVSEPGQAKAPRLRMLGRHRTKQDG